MNVEGVYLGFYSIALRTFWLSFLAIYNKTASNTQ